VTNNGSANVTVIDGATNSTTTLAAAGTPYAVAVNPVTNKIYVAGNNVTVIDGATNSTATVTVGSQPFALAVNEITNRIYVANGSSSNVSVITEQQVQPNPLTTAITPLAGNTTTSAAQMFPFAAANIASLPVTNLYFAFDTFEGAWRRGNPVTPGNFTGAASGLSVGSHIVYAFATDGEEATSIMPASNPVIGGIAAYVFDELGISTTTTLTADVNPAIVGQQVTFTAAVFSTTTGTPAGSVSLFDSSVFLGNAAIDNTGHAALQTKSLALGAHSITAAYIPSASAGFAASTSTAVNESILRASSTALVSSVLMVSAGQQVTFTAAVTSSSGGTPTGGVTFLTARPRSVPVRWVETGRRRLAPPRWLLGPIRSRRSILATRILLPARRRRLPRQ
jgi:YVTN family beta-propeller protein